MPQATDAPFGVQNIERAAKVFSLVLSRETLLCVAAGARGSSTTTALTATGFCVRRCAGTTAAQRVPVQTRAHAPSPQSAVQRTHPCCCLRLHRTPPPDGPRRRAASETPGSLAQRSAALTPTSTPDARKAAQEGGACASGSLLPRSLICEQRSLDGVAWRRTAARAAAVNASRACSIGSTCYVLSSAAPSNAELLKCGVANTRSATSSGVSTTV